MDKKNCFLPISLSHYQGHHLEFAKYKTHSLLITTGNYRTGLGTQSRNEK